MDVGCKEAGVKTSKFQLVEAGGAMRNICLSLPLRTCCYVHSAPSPEWAIGLRAPRPPRHYLILYKEIFYHESLHVCELSMPVVLFFLCTFHIHVHTSWCLSGPGKANEERERSAICVGVSTYLSTSHFHTHKKKRKRKKKRKQLKRRQKKESLERENILEDLTKKKVVPNS